MVSVTAGWSKGVSFEVVGSNLPVDIFIFKILTIKKLFEKNWFKYQFHDFFGNMASRQLSDGGLVTFFTMTFLQP